MKILSIDAWAECCGCEHNDESEERCWTWNQWFTVGDVGSVPDDPIGYLIDEGYLKPIAREGCYVADDQFNIVIHDKTDDRPLYAFEYGADQV